ncbi:MAG: hypothetical protein ABJB34_00885, partial [Acidobacteriota bacterium]
LRTHTRSIGRAIAGRLSRRLAKADGIDAGDRELQALIERREDSDDALIKTVVAIYHAGEAYHPVGKTYSGRITFFWAKDDEVDFEDNRLGWRRLAAGGLDVHEVPGTHGSMREEPNVAMLVAELRPSLESSQSANAGSSQS